MSGLVGKTIRGYEIRDILGRGGFGAVYRAYQPAVSREVALKVILPEYASDPDFVRGFEVEAQLVARLEHPHIVPLYDFWQDNEGAFIVMRLLKGGDLRELLDKQGALPPVRISRLLDQICGALTVAHRGGVVHRDLKPDNILLDEDGNSYLTDFGIARPVGHNMTQDNISGSIPYMSPEQLMGEPPTPRADIYSLGILLFEMATGQHPYASLNPTQMIMKHLNDPLPEPMNVPVDLSEFLRALLNRMTAKDPQARFEDALSVATTFRQMLNQQPLTETLLRLSQPDNKQSSIIQEHLDGLYRRLDSLYERLGQTQHEASLEGVRAEIQKLQVEIDYRNSRLMTVERHTPLTLPPALCSPSAPSYALVGVQKQVERIRQTLFSDKSVVLLGPSGAGKTELASLLARDPDVLFHFENRVVWFPAGKDADIAAILGDWLQAMGIPPDKFAGLNTLEKRRRLFLDTLGNQRMLVIVDDLWQLDDLKNSILDARNQLVYIVTTVLAEIASDLLWEIVRLDALPIPERVTLLHNLVSEIQPDDQGVLRLVERIGGLPRDLILLGTRLRRAGSSASRLRREVEKLAESPADVLEQGYASISLSVEALSDEARRALRVIALLTPEPNTFSEDAGEALCGDLAPLDELVDYSLLRAEHERYALHPSFAEYARKSIPLTDESEVRQRISRYYLDFVRAHVQDFNSLARESRNIETALQITAEDQPQQLAEPVLALWSFWSTRGMAEPAEKYLARLAAFPDLSAVQRAEVMLIQAQIMELNGETARSAQQAQTGIELLAGISDDTGADLTRRNRLLVLLTDQRAGMLDRMGDAEGARRLWLEALNVASQQNSAYEISIIYNSLGSLAINAERNPTQAKEYYLKSLEAARQAAADLRLCQALQNLGLLEGIYFSDFRQAKAYLNESWEIAHRLGHLQHMGDILMNRGSLELMQNHLEPARAHFEEALQKARLAKNSESIGYALLLLGNMVISLGQFADAEAYLLESMEIARRREDSYQIASIIDVTLKCGESRIIAMQIPDKLQPYRTLLDAGRQAGVDAVKLAKLENLLERLAGTMSDAGRAVALAQYNLSLIEGREFHDYNQAKIHLSESVRLAREAGDHGVLALALYELVHARIETGDESEVILPILNELTALPALSADLLPRIADQVQTWAEARTASQQPPLPEVFVTSVLTALKPLDADRLAALTAALSPAASDAPDHQPH